MTNPTEIVNTLKRAAFVGTALTATGVLLTGDTVIRPVVTKLEVLGVTVLLANLLSACGGSVTPESQILKSDVSFRAINGMNFANLSLEDQQKINQTDDAFHKAESDGKLNYININGDKATGGVKNLVADASKIEVAELDPNIIQDKYEPVVYQVGNHEMAIKPMAVFTGDKDTGEPVFNYVLFGSVDGGEWGAIGVPDDRNSQVKFTSIEGGVKSPPGVNFRFFFNDSDFPHMTPFGIAAGSSTKAPFVAGFEWGETADKAILVTDNLRLTSTIPGMPAGAPLTDENIRLASGKLLALAAPIIPGTPTPEPATAIPPVVSLSEIFKVNPNFYTALSAQDKKASEHFVVENEKTFLIIGSQRIEIDPASAGVNVDINGNPLLVEDTGYANPITIHGVGESEGKVFAFAPETKIKLDATNEKIFPAHWFEVIQSNHPVDQNASEDEKMKQREIAINDPVKVSVEQVQNGDWAESILLSGMVNPFSNDWKFTGNALNHQKDPNNSTVLYTSDKIPVDFFGVTTVGGKQIGLRPFQVWNPADLNNPNRNQVLIVNVGVGEENLTKLLNATYLDFIYKSNAEPVLIVSSSDELASSGFGGMIEQPSVLSLKQLSGNDPTKLSYVARIIEQFNITFGTDLWQTDPFYIDNQYMNIQNLIWLAYFS